MKVDAILLSNGENSAVCAGIWQIDWGDGFTTNQGEGTHSYNFNLNRGECKLVTVKISGVPIDAGCCDIKEYTKSIQVNICRPIANCFTGHREETGVYYFTDNGTDYRIKYELGQRSNGGFLLDEKAWVKAIFQKKKNNYEI